MIGPARLIGFDFNWQGHAHPKIIFVVSKPLVLDKNALCKKRILWWAFGGMVTILIWKSYGHGRTESHAFRENHWVGDTLCQSYTACYWRLHCCNIHCNQLLRHFASREMTSKKGIKLEWCFLIRIASVCCQDYSWSLRELFSMSPAPALPKICRLLPQLMPRADENQSHQILHIGRILWIPTANPSA